MIPIDPYTHHQILSSGGNISDISGSSFSLIQAVKNGQLKECISYVEKIRLHPTLNIIDLLSAGDECGNTALHWAAYKKYYEIAKYLLSAGADPNIPNTDELQTPFHWACIGGNAYLVKYMLNNGGDPHLQDKRGYNSMLHAVQYNEINIVRYLIEKGVSIDSPDFLNKTSLHWAAYQGHTQLLLFLVNKGASVHTLDSMNRSALHWAAFKGNSDPIKALCDFGSKTDERDINQQTPGDLCKEKGFTYLAHYINVYRFHPLRKVGPIVYNLIWIFISISLFNIFGYIFNRFNMLPAWILFGLIAGSCKLFLEPITVPNSPNPFLPTWMICSYTFWLIYYIKYIIPAFPDTVFYHAITLLLLGCYYLTAFNLFFSDPGTVSSSTTHQDSIDFINSLEKEYELPDLCHTCLINKPIRTKHCRTCKKCVARFDHHCSWINNCVGVNNNLLFIVLLLLFTATYLISLVFNINYFLLDPLAPVFSEGKWNYIVYIYTEYKGLFLFMLYETFIMSWLSRLLYVQIYGVLFNVTMFESMRPPKPKNGQPQKKCCDHDHKNNSNNNNNNENEHNHDQQNNENEILIEMERDDDQEQESGPSSKRFNTQSRDLDPTETNLQDTLLIPKRSNNQSNPYDRGIKQNINEFIYERSKWFRIYKL
ncbi:hypothetical protein CYY_004016 [Polysphondylium violaceum]|uniref:Palmitoyltransferase n=1 Tax=Polysphondylium violaceum TaxID=133409 RepID=A0A8J4Q636_9MYCE|nr:hypothetical protein CYY_004016 [Polysphondylium violaceum]